MQRIVFLLLLFLYWNLFSGQMAMSQKWRDYFSYKPCFDIVETNESVLGATTLGLILFDKGTQSVSVLNKTNGLSDSDLSTLGYHPDSQMAMIGYANGNIDLLYKGSIFNIPDLKIDNMPGSKRINHFMSIGEKVFCSTDFGILIIDPEKREISATYYIGEEASSLKVFSITADNDHIYAATSSGVLRAPRSSDQLAFFQTWELVSPTSGNYCDVIIAGNLLLAARGTKGENVTLEVLNSGNAEPLEVFNNFWSLNMSPTGFMVDTQSKHFFFDNNLQQVRTLTAIPFEDSSYQPFYKKSLIASDGTLWIADQSGGLFFEKDVGNWQQVLPPGPLSNSTFNVTAAGETVWILPGGFKEALNNASIPAYISVFNKGKWQYFTRGNTPEFKGTVDLINSVVHPNDRNKVLVASWGSGIFEFNDLSLTAHYTKDNSGLQNIFEDERRYTRIRGLAYDRDNNLWITNTEVENGVVLHTPDDRWFRYNYETLTTPNSLGNILVDNNGYKWLIVHRGDAKGMFVFDDNGTLENQSDDRYRGVMMPSSEKDKRNAGQMLLWDENGEEIVRDIFSMVLDKNGYLWLGTATGVVIQYNTGTVFRDGKPVFSRIKVPRNDGSGLADYLLENERITSIAVDGANRKYLGTQNSGVYLVSEDGTKTLASYHTGNSPLPSNLINHLSIDPVNGQVFIATDMGLVSFRGDAVKGKNAFSDVYAYPNPVHSHYDGPITITGLMERTNVKITDTAGNLVYETTSLGGNALWNGKNLWGQKVKAGIYIVLLSSPDGSSSAYTKIAIIR